MKILLILMVVLCLIIVIGLCWMSFKMLRETQKQAQIEHAEKAANKDSKP